MMVTINSMNNFVEDVGMMVEQKQNGHEGWTFYVEVKEKGRPPFVLRIWIGGKDAPSEVNTYKHIAAIVRTCKQFDQSMRDRYAPKTGKPVQWILSAAKPREEAENASDLSIMIVCPLSGKFTSFKSNRAGTTIGAMEPDDKKSRRFRALQQGELYSNDPEDLSHLSAWQKITFYGGKVKRSVMGKLAFLPGSTSPDTWKDHLAYNAEVGAALMKRLRENRADRTRMEEFIGGVTRRREVRSLYTTPTLVDD